MTATTETCPVCDGLGTICPVPTCEQPWVDTGDENDPHICICEADHPDPCYQCQPASHIEDQS